MKMPSIESDMQYSEFLDDFSWEDLEDFEYAYKDVTNAKEFHEFLLAYEDFANYAEFDRAELIAKGVPIPEWVPGNVFNVGYGELGVGSPGFTHVYDSYECVWHQALRVSCSFLRFLSAISVTVWYN
jgi:hypothetical protein